MIYYSQLLSPAYPMTHARIGWHSYDYTASGAIADATNIANTTTYDTSAFTGLVTLTFSSSKAVDYVGILSKTETTVSITCGTKSYSVTLYKGANMFLFDEQTVSSLTISCTATIAHVKAGLTLDMQRSVYGGLSPIKLSRKTSVRPNLSETGQFLGSTVKRVGYGSSIDFQNLTADWYRSDFEPFVNSVPMASPFFIAWRPSSFPDEVVYAWATNDIQPTNSGVRDLMAVTLNFEAFYIA